MTWSCKPQRDSQHLLDGTSKRSPILKRPPIHPGQLPIGPPLLPDDTEPRTLNRTRIETGLLQKNLTYESARLTSGRGPSGHPIRKLQDQRYTRSLHLIGQITTRGPGIRNASPVRLIELQTQPVPGLQLSLDIPADPVGKVDLRRGQKGQGGSLWRLGGKIIFLLGLKHAK